MGPSNAPTITNEPLRAHRWIIQKLGNTFVGDATKLLFVAQSFTPPNRTIEPREIQGGQLVYKFAEKVNWDDVVVSFYDVRDMLPKLEEWHDTVYTNEDGIKVHSSGGGYKQESIFTLLSGQGIPVREHKLHGSWPKRIEHAEMSYTSSELKLVTVTIAYDWSEDSAL